MSWTGVGVFRPAFAVVLGAAACGGGSSHESSDASAPVSCQGSGPGISECGPDGVSCCTSLPVSGGTFYRSYDGVSSGFTSMAYPASVSSFRLDKFEVTIARFRRFIQAVRDEGWRPTWRQVGEKVGDGEYRKRCLAWGGFRVLGSSRWRRSLRSSASRAAGRA